MNRNPRYPLSLNKLFFFALLISAVLIACAPKKEEETGPLTAGNQTVTAYVNIPIEITLTASADESSDLDTISEWVITAQPSKGTFTQNGVDGNVWIYTADSVGTDQIKYKVKNSEGVESSEGTVTINIDELSLTGKVCYGIALPEELADDPIFGNYNLTGIDEVKCRFVTPTGYGVKNGTSWANAYGVDVLRDPSLTISDVPANNLYILLVKEGIYKPDVINLDASFKLKDRIFVIGGFLGSDYKTGGTTTLSGDLSGNDSTSDVVPDLSDPQRTDNSKSVVKAVDSNSKVILANVTISGGNDGSTRGAGINVNNIDSILLVGVNVTKNASGLGGGIYIKDSSAVIISSNFTLNYSSNDGGGIFLEGDTGSMGIYSSLISSNTAARHGGGIFVQGSGSMDIYSSSISSNTSGKDGGGLYTLSTVKIYSSLISSNESSRESSTTVAGGGGIFSSGNTLEIYSSLISSNATSSHNDNRGGGLHLIRADTKIISSTITSNLARDGGGIYVDNESKLDFVNSTIAKNNFTAQRSHIEQSFHYNAPSSIIRFTAVNSIITGFNYGRFSSDGSSQFRYLYSFMPRTSRDNKPDLALYIRIAPVIKERSYIGTAPTLDESLANNGGEVQTMEILAGSSAINAGTYVGYDEDDNLCFDFTPDSSTRDWRRADSINLEESPENCAEPVSEITVDGRGYGFNGRPDIGAFEYMGNAPSN